MEKLVLQNDYKTARSMVIVIIILSAMNLLLFLFVPDLLYLNSFLLPRIVANFVNSKLDDGTLQLIFAIISGLAVLGVYLLSYFKSKEKSIWLLPATILFGIDVIVYSFSPRSSDFTGILDFLIELFAFASVVKGFISGRKLKDDFIEEEVKVIDEGNKKIELFKYDEDFAKKHGAVKTKQLIIASAVLLGSAIVATFLLSYLARLGHAWATYVFLAVILLAFGYYVFTLIKIAPFENAKSYTYYLDSEGYICRLYGSKTERLEEFKLVQEKDDCFVCTCKGMNKPVKLVIPNAYPRIEKIIRKNVK